LNPPKKEYSLSLADWLILLVVTPLIYLFGWSWRIEEEGRTELGPRARPQQKILWPFWHETILAGVWWFRHVGVHVMISSSRDGELIATLAKFLGYTPVRGSSTRGGQEAAKEMVEYINQGKPCAITPDGPRGPRRQMKMGTVQIARLTGCSVVPYGFAAEHAWRLRSWDRFIIPKPFTRGVFVYGEPIQVPEREGNEKEYLEKIQAEMDRVTRKAENHFEKRR
jgi:lysophospholipid acyltransferase (LPLAT)-like uncharacterized protein